MIVWRASGVLTWDVGLAPWFFVTCGLAAGGGLMLVVCAFLNWAAVVPIPLVVISTAIANAWVWILYLRRPGEQFQRETAPLRQASHIALTLGVGHLLPVVLSMIALAAPQPLILVTAGLGFLFGGVMQKFAFAFQARTMRL
jgi:hypothetical protein